MIMTLYRLETDEYGHCPWRQTLEQWQRDLSAVCSIHGWEAPELRVMDGGERVVDQRGVTVLVREMA